MPLIRTLLASRWVRYALSAGLLGILLWRVQPGKISSSLGSIRPQYLILALALTVPFLYLKALRWHLMLLQGGVRAGFGEAVASLLGGMGIALLTPARLGELVRGAYLRDEQKLKIGGLVMLDKGFDVLVLCGLSVAGAWAIIGWWAGMALAGVTLVGLACVYRPAMLSAGLHGLSGRLPLRDKLERIWGSLDCLTPAATTEYLALTLLSFGVVLLQSAIILLSWHGWSFDIVVLTFPLVILTNVVPITIGGLGVREGAAAILLPHYGVSAAHAAIAAFLMFFVNTALPGLAGALLLPGPARASRTPSLDPS